ncbi:tigger transposable element-derived protein 1-like [Aphis craccivora]|uniref:Tigger transposable element-derived protein 1-like n=1 Tax=Aphis craccivora TaxID=307492 RepID=A0A6G0Y006_APHCR|nr:tigger transposable element-derived protein 1-like [Aphis craccivora]
MKRRRKVLTLVQKIEILDKIKSGDTVASLARKYEMNESSVREIRKNEVAIRRSVMESAPISSKTCFITRDVMVEKTEKALNIWIEDQTQKKVPLSSIIIREKAKQLHQHFTSSSKGDSENSSFLASKGWFEKFKNRCNLHNVKLVGESASADHLAAKNFPIELKNVIEQGGYTPEQVFNADETGLFWKRMPSRTFLSKNEKTAPGFKAAKDRLTLLLCANACGFMIKSMVVYKSLKPRAFKSKDMNHLPVFWRANNKAWVTAQIFSDWFTNCFIPQVEMYLKLKNLPFKALLLIDNAPGHPPSLKFQHSNIEVMFMPPNTTSLLQPLDQGVIAAFKAYYVRRTFQRLLKNLEEDPELTVTQGWKNYDIAKCLVNIKESLDEVQPSTINACWRKLWPEVVLKSDKIDNLNTTVNQIVKIARNVKGFDEVNKDDIEEMMFNYDQELTLEDLEEITDTPNEPKQSEDDEEEVEPVKPDFSSKSIKEIFSLANQLTEKVFMTDPLTERAFKFKRGIQELLVPYEEVCKDIENKRKQTSITNFFHPS